jgi:hypothetical protein
MLRGVKAPRRSKFRGEKSFEETAPKKGAPGREKRQGEESSGVCLLGGLVSCEILI